MNNRLFYHPSHQSVKNFSHSTHHLIFWWFGFTTKYHSSKYVHSFRKTLDSLSNVGSTCIPHQ